MALSYRKLFMKLAEKDMTRVELAQQAGISLNTMVKLRRGESCSLATMGKMCSILKCNIGDLVEWIPDEEQEHRE